MICPGALPSAETAGAYQLTVATPRHIHSIACGLQYREQLGHWLRTDFGLALPDPGYLAARTGVTILSSAQDQWFLEQEGEIADDMCAPLERALSGIASVTEQTGGWARFEINGPNPTKVLSRLCPLDATQMAADQVARTNIHHIGCLVWRVGSGFAVMGPRSTAGSLWHALKDAALSASLQAH
ncbi:sarcosine oxidase subunit gamma [Seohaeicola sp.]